MVEAVGTTVLCRVVASSCRVRGARMLRRGARSLVLQRSSSQPLRSGPRRDSMRASGFAQRYRRAKWNNHCCSPRRFALRFSPRPSISSVRVNRRESDQSMCRAVWGMRRAEEQPFARYRALNPGFAGQNGDDLFDSITEAPIRHFEHHRVILTEFVQHPEGAP